MNMNETMNYFVDPITKHYVDFDGKATRKEFWMFVLISFVISVFVGLIGGLLHLGFLSAIYSLGLFLPSLAIGVRRLHDINKSGWWILISLIPLIGIIWLIILRASDSKKESVDNKPETSNVENL